MCKYSAYNALPHSECNLTHRRWFSMWLVGTTQWMCLLLLCEVFQMTTVFSDCAAVCLEFLVKYLPSAASLPGIFVKCVLSDKALSTLQQVCQLSSSLPTDQISPFSCSKLICTCVKLTQTSPWMGPSYSERSNGPLNCSFGVTFLKPRKGYWAVKLAPCHRLLLCHRLLPIFHFYAYFVIGWVLPHRQKSLKWKSSLTYRLWKDTWMCNANNLPFGIWFWLC